MSAITVILDPEQRQAHVRRLLELEGLGDVEEDTHTAYCPISLTNTPDDLKAYLRTRQAVLADRVLAPAGIHAYDPGSAPFSPDRNLTTRPDEVYTTDSGKIASARYFTGHHLVPSTGLGIELEKAKTLGRVSVILADRAIRVSRMQPHRTIYLEYTNFTDQADEFIPVFRLLQEFEPGIGLNGPTPALLGFERGSSRIVDLEELVYQEFPQLQYHWKGTVPILKVRAENPDLFYEHREPAADDRATASRNAPR
ncbi:MAG: hypothetical protein HY369_01170 [Candidatus Aenigmarchaeota archaeon]|nr:hypothetical protein [Candidatus Aenigmarchaeota archaeon]